MDDSLPYKVDYSAGSQKCKGCHHKIKQGHLQMAIMIQSNDDDCLYPEWYHRQCFFKVRLPPTEAAFDGFALLRYVDQQVIREDLGFLENDASVTDVKAVALPSFGIEYCKGTRDKCVGCNRKLNKGDIRIMKVQYDENQNAENETCDGKAIWYHIACFARLRSDIGWLESGDSLPGFKRLAEEDKDLIKKHIPLIRRDVKPTKKLLSGDLSDLEKQIKIQNNEYFKIFDEIAKNVSKDEQIEILKHNRQAVPKTESQILHHLTDVIYFGALNSCKCCFSRGRFVFNNSVYKCIYCIDWNKCGNEEKEPQRRVAKIPENLLTKYPFLQPDACVRIRILHFFRLFDEEGNDLVYGPYKKPLLFNMEFVLIGKFSKPRENIERAIKKLGGKVATEIHEKLAAVISTKMEVQKMGKEMLQAKTLNIQVVPEGFLNEISATDPITCIISKNICSWGGDPLARIQKIDVATRKETIFYTKSLPEKVVLKWKDGTAVDPECGLDENVHVYVGPTSKKSAADYSVILGLVDIENNKNSYHRMQLLVSSDRKSYWLFQSWGRISTVVGSKSLRSYESLDEAVVEFKAVYKEKTGNIFGSKFQKRPNQYYHLDIELGMPKKMSNAFVESKLDKPLHDLMQMIFDVKQMENMMCGCDLDLKQMPLGKISEKQIKLAMSTLNYIAKLIQKNGTPGQLRDQSNKFYTLIPHAFSIKRPPVIDTIETVNAKNELLESLLNMELIYGFLEGENGEKSNPLDACYRKLGAKIIPLDKCSQEFQTFCWIVEKSHGPTHTNYTLEVLDIFKVVRDGEDNQEFNQIDNHQLLWHGSRVTNFVNIISNGLKIAPPEAPHSGYMFGKGIYFADVVTKSANYCYTNPYSDTGLMLLCEVALGAPKPMYLASNIVDIPNSNFQSIKAFGIFHPTVYSRIDNVRIPIGELKQEQIQTSLYYNEFVVYNPAQVKIKYLFKMKFHFKPASRRN